ncbi:MAG: type II toxin-antitoxin system VapC family toxin [Solirubrobacteraceae bacterium]
MTGDPPADGQTGPPYLLDTHIWFWYLIGSERLPPGLRGAIERAREELWLSPISVWELSLLEQRRRVRLRDGAQRWIEQALRHVPLHEAALTGPIALRSVELDLPHRDPADRFIAATALAHGLTLMTVDERLTGAEWLATRSV